MFNDQILEKEHFNPQIINYGLSIYDLIRIENCIPVFYEQYISRLQNSLKFINKSLWFGFDQLFYKIQKLISLNCATTTSFLKLIISFNNDYFGSLKNLFIAYFAALHQPSPKQYAEGVYTITLQEQRLNPNAKIYLPHLRSKTENFIKSHNITEVILLTQENIITEGSRSNVFFIKNNTLFTPHLKMVLPGITRQNVIKIAKQLGIKVQETDIYYNQLAEFEAAFLTATSKKILPIKRIDNILFRPQHPLIQTLLRQYNQLINSYVSTHKNLAPDCSHC